MAVHQHQEGHGGGHERTERKARQQQRGDRRARPHAGHGVDEEHRPERPGKGGQRRQCKAEPYHPERQEERQRRPQRCATGGANDVGIGHRVAQETLEDSPRQGQRAAHDRGADDAGQADAPDDSLGLLRPGWCDAHPRQPPDHDPGNLAEGHSDRAQCSRQPYDQNKHRAQDGYDPPLAPMAMR